MFSLLDQVRDLIEQLSYDELEVYVCDLHSLYILALHRYILQNHSPNGLDESRLLPMLDVARRLQLSEATVREMGRRGELPTVKVGRSVRVRESAIRDFVKAHEGGGYGLRTGPQRIPAGRLPGRDGQKANEGLSPQRIRRKVHAPGRD